MTRTRLNRPDYMKFPLTIGEHGAETSERTAHVREQIEQVLFTMPGERWYRPGFGAGVRALIFEPNNTALEEVVKKRLHASLTEALAGEVDPKTLSVEAEADGEKLIVTISYTLAALNHTERQEFLVGSGGGSSG